MNSDELILSVYEVVGSPLCVASGDGQKVFERAAGAMKGGKRVVLTFKNVTSMTSAFLNAAIGQLYGVFKEEDIRALLKVQDMEKEDLALLKRVVDAAKEYFKDPKRLASAVKSALGDDTDAV
jgi:hypothetical protein